MVARAPAVQLLGRQREREVLDRVLEAARGGHSGVLAVYGEAGVGKTALLGYAIEGGADFRLARTVGVEGEMELAFAALQQLARRVSTSWTTSRIPSATPWKSRSG
jgi:AAA ATPase domain